MASGILGKAFLSSVTPVTVYTVPASAEFATLNINVVNTSQDPEGETKISIAITKAAVPAMEDYIEYMVVIPELGGIIERTGLILSSLEKVIVSSSMPNVVVRINGIEEML